MNKTQQTRSRTGKPKTLDLSTLEKAVAGLKESRSEWLEKRVKELQGEVEYLECEAQAYRVLARLVAEHGLCSPDLQVARARPEQVFISQDREEIRIAVEMMVMEAVNGVKNT